MNLKLLVLIFLETYGVANQPNGDVQYYDIKFSGLTVGNVIATRKQIGTATHYSLKSSVNVWMIVSVQMDHTVETCYYQNIMLHSKSISKTRNEEFHSFISRNNDRYTVEVNSYHEYKNSKSILEPIEWNIARLYFEEPINGSKALVDSYGLLADIKKIKEGHYEVKCQGRSNYYIYKEGRLRYAKLYGKVTYEVVQRE